MEKYQMWKENIQNPVLSVFTAEELPDSEQVT